MVAKHGNVTPDELRTVGVVVVHGALAFQCTVYLQVELSKIGRASIILAGDDIAFVPAENLGNTVVIIACEPSTPDYSLHRFRAHADLVLQTEPGVRLLSVERRHKRPSHGELILRGTP